MEYLCPSVSPSVHPQEKFGSHIYMYIYRHICLMNNLKTHQTNLMAQWDPLDIPLEPKAPPSTPMTLKQVFWPH